MSGACVLEHTPDQEEERRQRLGDKKDSLRMQCAGYRKRNERVLPPLHCDTKLAKIA